MAEDTARAFLEYARVSINPTPGGPHDETRHSELCPLSTMKDLYALIREADRVVTF